MLQGGSSGYDGFIKWEFSDSRNGLGCRAYLIFLVCKTKNKAFATFLSDYSDGTRPDNNKILPLSSLLNNTMTLSNANGLIFIARAWEIESRSTAIALLIGDESTSRR